AAGVRWPHRIWLRLEGNRFCVGYTVAQLRGLAARDQSRTGIKRLNCEVFAAKLLERSSIGVALSLFSLLCGLPVDLAILLPAGKQNPTDRNGNDQNDR